MTEPTADLPEPDYWLIGPASDAERAKWHGEWHHQNRTRGCEQPDRPQTLYLLQSMTGLTYGFLASLIAFVVWIVWMLAR